MAAAAVTTGGPGSGAGGSLCDGGVCPRATAAATAGRMAAAEVAAFGLQSLLLLMVTVGQTVAAAGRCFLTPSAAVAGS